MTTDQRVILTYMAHQLYLDIRFVTEQSPAQILDDEGARAFNSLLSKAREFFPNITFLQDFNEISPRTVKYKDALVMAGQLFAMLRCLTGNQPAAPRQQQQAPPAKGGESTPPPQRSSGEVPVDESLDIEPENRHDFELYGPKPPSKRNPDGTIPFSLE